MAAGPSKTDISVKTVSRIPGCQRYGISSTGSK